MALDVLDYLKIGSDHSDFTLVCNGVRFPVHKAILAARSKVFFTMFQHDNTKEAATKEVEIVDADIPTLKDFIKYVWIQHFLNLSTKFEFSVSSMEVVSNATPSQMWIHSI